MNSYKYEIKPRFRERMKKLLPDEKDFEAYESTVHTPSENFIRANTNKISPAELKERLGNKWQVIQPFPEYEEIMLIKSGLKPGEIGKATEHILGYYYVQELSSMMSILALKPKADEKMLDLCASPGSKTTQASMMMENKGTIIANDKTIGRIAILASNLERCSCSNTIITKTEGVNLAERMKKQRIKFQKILVDAPCSGEGTLRSNPKTFLMWNENMIKFFSKLQKKLLLSALELLEENGELVYSTCTHAPEENEEVVSIALEKFPNLELEEIKLPIKTRKGLVSWNGKKFPEQIKKCCRIYPQDNNTEGFFVAKFRIKS